MELAQKHQDELCNLKEMVNNSYLYFEENYKRFNYFKNFVFNTSLSETDRSVLEALGKPEIEFNMLEAMVSRLRGEFSKQMPSVKVTGRDDTQQVDPEVIEVVEGYLRYIMHEADLHGCSYHVYTDTLSGGFSAVKIWTEYEHEMSFNQVIKIGRVFDPTLCGWDPLAKLPHKGDGRYCFELYPMAEYDFKSDYPEVEIKSLSFARGLEGFNWSYRDGKEKIVIVCELFMKKKIRKKLVQLVNGQIMFQDDYKNLIDEWEMSGLIEAPPGIKGKPRWTEITKVCRYRFIENKVLDYVETDFKELPIVFIDGNSQMLRDDNGGDYKQMTRPYVYQAKGVQKLKNFAGQTLANELENLIQHKFKVAKESLPDEQEYLNAYTDIQKANTLVYNAYSDNDPNKPVPPPQEIARVPAPPEVMNTIQLSDSMLQTTLGSYDASLGINNNQLSGVAIVEGATQSNSAAMPYVVSYLEGWSQIYNICLDLIPKYYVTPRTLPVVQPDGSREYIKINQPGGQSLKYHQNALNVNVEAGVNFAIQKSRALQQIIAMSQASPLFSQFINTKGLSVILDNFEIRGVDQLKEMAEEFMQEQKQNQAMQQQAAQQQMMNNPAMLNAKTNMMKAQSEIKSEQFDQAIKAADMNIQKQDSDTKSMVALAQMQNKAVEQAVMVDRASAEKARASADLAIKEMDIKQTHARELAESIHSMAQDVRKHAQETDKSDSKEKNDGLYDQEEDE